jgi:hypothetical protein
MADELEILKSDWKKRQQNLPKLSYNEIYKMLYKKSTTIVKWIFIISIAELIFWTSLSLITPQSTHEVLDLLGLTKYLMIFNIIHYIIFIGFIVVFFKNYASIKVTDNTKQLMASILKTRKTVRFFVIYNVTGLALLLILLNLLYYFQGDLLFEYFSQENGVAYQDKETFMLSFYIVNIIFGIVMLGLVLLFYRIVYGIFLKRLKKNYNELAKIEI